LLVLTLYFWKHVASIMSFPAAILFFESPFHLLGALIAGFGQSIC
jgi:hypothetical protein